MRFRLPLFAILFIAGSLALPHLAHAGIPFFGPIIPDDINRCAAGWGAMMDVINRIIMLLITLAIVFVAPIMIAYAGFLYVVNAYDPSGMAKAKGILTNTIVGIVVALAGWLIVDAVMAVLYSQGAQTSSGTLGVWSSLITSSGDACLLQEGQLKSLKPAVNIQGINGSGLITTPGGTQIGSSGLNVTNAVAALDSRAQSASTGYCAQYVRQALVAGGFTQFSSGGPNAKDYGPLLTGAGFSVVSGTLGASGYAPQVGDVVVFQSTSGSANGHIQMYDGKQWVSDYKQVNPIPPAVAGGSYQIYRA